MAYCQRIRDEEDATFECRVDEYGNLSHAFMQTAYQRERYLTLRRCHLLDTTYNTNHLGMKLTPLTAMNEFGESEELGYAVTAGQASEDYSWILSQIKKTMQRTYGKAVRHVQMLDEKMVRRKICMFDGAVCLVGFVL